MRLQFLGATGTVTGSKYLVTAGAARVLVDCGLFQGYKPLRLRNWAPLPLDPARIDAVVLTHAHIDHSGYLPLLARNGFRGKAWCTPATLELCRILLPDSAHLQEEQAEHANRFGYSKHKPALPLYTQADAGQALKQLHAADFDRPFSPAAGIEAVFRPAGHILGAAIAVLRAEERSIAFSGDLGRADDALMKPAAFVEDADAVVLESTYGAREHVRDDPGAKLARIVSETAARGGVTVIPAFAVGRAQALMVHLARARGSGAIPASLPIYLDSPMASDVTGLYLRFAGEHRLSREDCAAMAHVVRDVRTPQESQALDASPFPKVIVSASGMATGGRVLHHLRRFAPDPRNAVVLAGFQAGGTRGADLARGVSEVKIFGEWVAVRAQVSVLEGLSAHADAGELVDWLAHFRREPRRIFLTHGEPESADALRKRIARRLGWRAEIPDYLEVAQL